MKSDLNWWQILRPLNYNTVKNKWLLMPQISNSLQIQSVMICKIPKNLLFHNIMVMYFLFYFYRWINSSIVELQHNFIKLFWPQLKIILNKLSVSSRQCLLSFPNVLHLRSGAYPRIVYLKCASLWYAPGFTHKH
jgi:hypothetical protein